MIVCVVYCDRCGCKIKGDYAWITVSMTTKAVANMERYHYCMKCMKDLHAWNRKRVK